MDMTPIQWVLIVLLVLLIAVGVYMLTRKPSSGQGRSEQAGENAASQSAASYGAGGEHVAAGDAGVTPSAPLYDQEADAAAIAESSVQDDPIDAPVWDGDDSLGQDTATGGDIEIVEEEPVVSVTEDVEPRYVDPAGEADNGDRDQMSYGDPQAEDFASETVYAEAPVQDYTAVDDAQDVETYTADPDGVDPSEVPDAVVMDDGDDVPSDAAAAGFGGATGATVMGGDQASDYEVGADADLHADSERVADVHEGHAHEHPVTENLGPRAEDEIWAEDHPEQGHPGGRSQHGEAATYAAADDSSEGSENTGPEEGEGGADDRDDDQGHPGPDSQPGDEATYVAGAGAIAASVPAAERTDDDRDAFEDAEASEVEAHDVDAGSEDGEIEHGDIEVVESDVAFADGSQTDEVPVVVEVEDAQVEGAEGVAFENDEDRAPVAEDKGSGDEVRTDESTLTDDGPAEAVMIDVDDYGTHEAEAPDTDADADADESTPHDTAAPDADKNAYAPVAVEEDHSEPVEHSHETDTAGDDQPQAVMIDVDDYGTHEAVQPDHNTEVTEVEHHDAASDDTDQHQIEEDTYSPLVAEEDHSETVEHAAAEDVPQDDYVAEDTAKEQPFDEPAEETNQLIEASPYGVGSAIPGDDGNGPEGYEIKGNAGSMLFHTPESPSYEECTPEVFFENEDAARAAGFAHWDRKRR